MLNIYENKEAGGKRVKLDRRCYLTAAGKVVEEGHPEAATLYASEGKEVSRADFAARGGVAINQSSFTGAAASSVRTQSLAIDAARSSSTAGSCAGTQAQDTMKDAIPRKTILFPTQNATYFSSLRSSR